MHGWDLAALLIGVFWLGGFVALLGRAMLEASRIKREGRDVYDASLQSMSRGDRQFVLHLRATHDPPSEARRPVAPPPKPADAWRSVTPPRSRA